MSAEDFTNLRDRMTDDGRGTDGSKVRSRVGRPITPEKNPRPMNEIDPSDWEGRTE